MRTHCLCIHSKQRQRHIYFYDSCNFFANIFKILPFISGDCKQLVADNVKNNNLRYYDDNRALPVITF